MKLRHARLDLELHELREGGGPPLLLLHALGGSSGDWAKGLDAWPGRVLALDFSGHGASGRRRGGCYTPELLGADAGLALREIGSCALAGAGLGAYVALLVSGARPDHVPAALLLPGRGLDGGGAKPDFDRDPRGAPVAALPPATDPAAHLLASDIRPPDYAASFAAGARALLFAEDGAERPPWWLEARKAAAASVSTEIAAALADLHGATLSGGGDA